MSSEEQRVELLQASRDLIVLRTLATMGPLHAYAIATRLEQISDYPALRSQRQGQACPKQPAGSSVELQRSEVIDARSRCGHSDPFLRKN